MKKKTEDGDAAGEPREVGDLIGKVVIRFALQVLNQGQRAGAVIAAEFRDVKRSTSTCLDGKECLEVFSDETDPANYAMRNSNELQLACLEGRTQELTSAQRAACDAWVACLTSAGSFSTFLAVLKAAVGSVVNSVFAQLDTTASEMDSSVSFQAGSAPAFCFDPAVDDLEGLDCNCVEVALQSCHAGETQAKCLRRKSCANPSVCQHWKS